MIDRIRLTSAAKVQLATIKRKTGIEHYNSICRHALCISLANDSAPPEEEFRFNDGLEMDWRTFCGGHEEFYMNLILIRIMKDNDVVSLEEVKKTCALHLHRGLSYMSSSVDITMIGERF